MSVQGTMTYRHAASRLDVACGLTSASAACTLVALISMNALLAFPWAPLVIAPAGVAFAVLARRYGRPSWSWPLSLVALASAIIGGLITAGLLMVLLPYLLTTLSTV